MRDAIKLLFIWTVAAVIGCSNNKAPNETKMPYKAIYKNDTANLNIVLKDREFYGQLEINYNGLYKDSGDVSGIIKGDTLRGTFYFQHYGIETKQRIPIALLKKDNKLIMGEGTMEIFMNITFFKKTVPIDYQKSKFVFKKIG
ncbi:hypothetical protein H7F33_13890 [Pedobacter sp. PAMC26386]|nr:hypothetical protein H7F33_13890 [Pedobacter sp. PAMC26386]